MEVKRWGAYRGWTGQRGRGRTRHSLERIESRWHEWLARCANDGCKSVSDKEHSIRLLPAGWQAVARKAEDSPRVALQPNQPVRSLDLGEAMTVRPGGRERVEW